LTGAAVSLAVVAIGWVGDSQKMSDARIHDYLVSHPDVVFEMVNLAQQSQADQEEHRQQTAVDKLGLKRFFDPAVAYVTGPEKAKNTFVEFFDYNCVHCRNSYPLVKKFYEAHKNDTRFAFVDYPIFGQGSNEAAQLAVAARRQNDLYVKLHFLLMGESGAVDANVLYEDAKKAGLDTKKLVADASDPAVGKTLTMAHKLAKEAEVAGTPTFIINGKVHSGEVTEADLKHLTKS
jgi:protein-disulfide isomerase